MNELMIVLNSRPITESTKKSHIQTFNKINTLVGMNGVPLQEVTFDIIMWMLDQEKTLSTSYKRKIISLFLIIKNYFNKLDSDLPRLQEFLGELIKINQVESSIKLHTEDTNQFEQIRDWIDAINIDADPVRYVVNYLIFYLNIRNLDLVVKVIDYDHECLIPTEDTGNYLMYSHFEVKYLRNSYKTKKTYGTKLISITDSKFVDAVSRIKFNTYLIKDTPQNIDRMLRYLTYKNMSETEYLHNVIQRYTGDINKILEIEFNRGSSVRTLLTAYNSDVIPK